MLKLIFPSLLILITSPMCPWWSIASATSMTLILYLTLIPLNKQMIMLTHLFITDNMSSSLTALTMLITSMMMLASTKIKFSHNHKSLFLSLSLILMLILVMAFNTSSLIMFYIWFEASLIPTLFIILLWGYQPERIQASMYLMMYTITASLPMLLMIILAYNTTKTSTLIFSSHYTSNYSLMWLMLILGFLVKLPMYMSHLWLPKAHVEAPIAGSMILAAILLKLGGYGLIRMILVYQNFMGPTHFIIALSSIGALLTSLICIRQPDMKSMIAYSSVGHMGLLIAGVLSMSKWGINGAIMMMIAHGLSSSALFILANISYSITHTRSSFMTKGMLNLTPNLSMWWFMLLAANMAAPPSINLMSEIMLMTSIISKSMILMLVIGLVSFFSAAYSLHLFSITQHGKPMSTSNTMLHPTPLDATMMITHLMPILLIISKPELILL